MIEIKRWGTGEVIHSGDFTSIKGCLEDGVRKEISFYRADLIGADLRGANLQGADLWRANLRWTNLRWTNLRWVNLDEVDLWRADLSGANLREARLSRVRLRNCTGNDKQIKNIPGGILGDFPYKITYTKDRLQIGCQGMSVQEWLSFRDEDIEALDSFKDTLYLKNQYKAFILNYIKDNPAEE